MGIDDSLLWPSICSTHSISGLLHSTPGIQFWHQRVNTTVLTGSDESEWDHVADESVSHPLLLLYSRSLSAQSRSAYHWVCLIAFVLYGMGLSFSHSVHFMLPNNVCILLKIHFHANYALCGYCILWLLLFCKFVEPNSFSTLMFVTVSSVPIIMSIKALLYIYLINLF